MSTVKLTIFSVYKVVGSGAAATIKTLAGSVAARFGDNGAVQLLADSVPFHSDAFRERAPKPGFGMLMLYGIRDTLEEMHFWRTKAREMQAEFAYAEIEFSVGKIEVGLTDRPKLKAAAGIGSFLNLRRMTSSLQSQVLHKFSEYAVSEGVNINESMSRVSQIATRPDLFDQLLEDDRDLSKLGVLVVPIADDPATPGRMRQVAYVKPGVEIVSIVQGNDQATVLLPNWMTDVNVAKKMRKETLAAA